MPLHITDRPALVLVDIQKAFEHTEYWGEKRNNSQAEKRASDLLTLWRKNDLPIFHIKHCSTNPASLLNENNKGNEFNDLVKPFIHETVIKKNVNSAFIRTDLEDRLINAHIKILVIVGLTTDHCVSTTTRMASNLGFDTYVISDATATFNKKGMQGEDFPAELIHATALASLNGEFATILTTDLLKQTLFGIY